MKSLHISIILCLVWTSFTFGQEKEKPKQERVVSTIDSTDSSGLVLIQEFTVDAPIDAVWEAYTTKQGWESWAVPFAEVNLKVGGVIKTNYSKTAAIDDSTTIVTHIINYVPKKLITLQAKITDNFSEFMKQEADDFYNVIYLDEVESGKTNVKSYGIGYKNTPKYLSLMEYFIPANEMTLLNLIAYLEEGTKIKHE